MRFRPSSSPPPYLNRRDQYRLLLLIGLLAGVLLAMQAVARPGMWSWMFSGETPPAEESATPRKTAGDVDFSVRFDDRALAADEFLAQADASDAGKPEELGDGVRTHADPGPASSSDAPPSASPQSPESASPAGDSPTATRHVEIDRDILRGIQDDYVGLRAAEADAYFHILSRAAALDQHSLERASAGTVDFAVLMDDPDRFRGRPVTVEGELKGLTPVPVAGNEHGIETAWEGWIFNSNSWPNPWCVRVLSVPRDIPQGSRLSQPVRVRVTGYFFKKYGYASEGGFHKAPLLLARQLDWLRSEPQAAAPLPGLGPWLMGVAVVVAAGLGIMVWRFRASDRRFEQSHLKRLTEAPRESIAALSNLETTDVSDLLRQLAEEDSTGNVGAVDRNEPGRAAPGTGHA